MKTVSKIATCSVAFIISLVVSNYGDEIRTSRAGLEMIGNAESCMREPYYCPAGFLTVGIGSAMGKIEDRVYSDQEIARRWIDDIKETEKCVNSYGNGQELPQPIFDAVVSITFNVGCPKIKNSTLYRNLNQGHFKAACDEFIRWNKANGVVISGLSIRREKERSLCLTGVTP